MSQILIIEDDVPLARGLADNLKFEGFAVTHAQSAEEGLRRAGRQAFDLVLLDLMLPGMNGFELLRQWQGRDDVPPVIVLSARDGETDIVRALDLGARDYVRKPFGVAELLARVRAQLRVPGDRVAVEDGPSVLAFHDVQVDLDKYLLQKGDERHLLSHTEVGLMALFLRHPGEPLRRTDILARVWGADTYPTERTVDNFVLKLRRKMEDDPHQPRFLRTVHGVGYCFTPDAAAP